MLVCLTAVLLAASLGAETRYLNAIPLRSGLTDMPELTLLGDFTRDGRNDVLVASATSIRVLPGSGNRTFGVPLATSIADLAAQGLADFNDDGTPDLYLSRRQGNGFAIMLGLGDGRFGAPSIVNAGADVLLIAGRFDADQRPDLAVISNTRPATVAVYPSDGAGGFGSPVTTSFTYLDASDAATGDFDGDGRVDVALTGVFSSWILWNDGGSRFTATGFDRGDAIAAGDFDGDGASDAIVTINDFDVARVWFGTKGARAMVSTNVPVPGFSRLRPHAGDFDGNGRTDVALFHESTVTTLTPAEGRSFNAPVLHLAGRVAVAGATGDLDGDGRMDVVLSSHTEKDAVWWIPGNGDGTLQAYRAVDMGRALGTTLPDALQQFALFDVDGDARFDIVVHDWRERRLSVLRSDGAGGFHPAVHTPAGEDVLDNVRFEPAGDLDGDGRGDLILTGLSAPTSRVFHGKSDGAFDQGALLAGVSIAGIVDLNGDERPDLLEFDGDLHPGNGNGTFGEPVRTTLAPARDLYFADLDDDGLTDVLVSRGNNLDAFLNAGQAAFSTARRTRSNQIVAIGDLTGDGLPDLVVDRSPMTIQRGRGDGTFEDGGPLADFRSMNGTGEIADFDGDGHNDVAVSAQILFGNGDGSFREVAGYRGLSGEFPYDLLAIANTGGDATPDLIVRSGNYVAIIPAGAPVRGTKAAVISLESSPNPSVYGAPGTLTARVTNEATAMKPKGAVRFEIAGRYTALVEVDGEGKASSGSAFEVGTTTVRAVYTGDEEFAGRTATLEQQTARAPSKTTIGIHRASGGALLPSTTFQSGDIVYVTAKATLSNGFGNLGGPLTVLRGSVVLGTLADSSARLEVPTPGVLPAGTHELRVEWPGDSRYLASSATITITVTARPGAPRRRGVRH